MGMHISATQQIRLNACAQRLWVSLPSLVVRHRLFQILYFEQSSSAATVTALAREQMLSPPSVRPSVSTPTFELSDLRPWPFACVWVVTMTLMELKVKVSVMARLECQLETRSVGPRSSVVVQCTQKWRVGCDCGCGNAGWMYRQCTCRYEWWLLFDCRDDIARRSRGSSQRLTEQQQHRRRRQQRQLMLIGWWRHTASPSSTTDTPRHEAATFSLESSPRSRQLSITNRCV